MKAKNMKKSELIDFLKLKEAICWKEFQSFEKEFLETYGEDKICWTESAIYITDRSKIKWIEINLLLEELKITPYTFFEGLEVLNNQND
jgi:hypothetical protein